MADKLTQAYDFLKRNGPILPVRVSKIVGTNIMMASALLSQLVTEKKIKITHESIGGSPLYYVTGQEALLQDRLGNQLNGKKKEAYSLLRDKKVLHDNSLEPPIRIALRELKDFAVPIDVTLNERIERYWRWYLTNNDQVKDILVKKETLEIKQDEIPQEKLEVEKKPKVREQRRVEIKKVEVKEEKEEKNVAMKKVSFYLSVDKYFDQNKVKILHEEIVRRDREFNFIIEIPSNLGKLRYFVKVINKKKVSDGDLSLAYSQAQTKNLHLLFLTNGEMTNKAKEHLDKNLGGVVFRNV